MGTGFEVRAGAANLSIEYLNYSSRQDPRVDHRRERPKRGHDLHGIPSDSRSTLTNEDDSAAPWPATTTYRTNLARTHPQT